MTTIQIPEGKTSMTLGNGMTIPIPQGATTIDIPDELLQAKEIPSLEIPKEATNQNPFIDNSQGVDFSQVQEPKPLKETNVLKDYEEANKPFIQQLFDKTVAKTKEMFNIGGSAVQDTVNILSPIGEANFMGKNYDNPITGVKGNESIVQNAIKENDLPLQAYNDINKLAKTDMSLFANEKDGAKTYNENLANIIIDKFGFDDLGIGSDGKYYATKGNETIQLNKDSLTQITSDIYGDKMELLGGYIGAKKGYDVGKTFGTKGKVIGGAIGGAIGAGAGNIVDMLDSAITNGEQLNASQYLDEVGKAATLDIGGGIAAGVAGKLPEVAKTLYDISGVPQASKAIYNISSDIIPISEKNNAERILNNKNNINTAENLNIADSAKELGATDTKLTQLASDNDARKALSNFLENDSKMVDTLLKDHQTLTDNVYTQGNIEKLVDNKNGSIKDQIGQKIDEQVKGISAVYGNVYDATKKDILDITGDRVINIPPKSYDTIKEKLNILETIPNVAKEEVPANGANPLDDTFKSIATKINNYFLDESGNPLTKYSLSGIMDAQKTLNSYASKHGDSLTQPQKDAISDIRKSLYDDIERYADTMMKPEEAKIIKDKWKDINGGYSEWFHSIGKDGNKIDSLLQDKSNIKNLAYEMVSKGTIDNKYLETFGDMALHIRKTNPEKLNELQDIVANSILSSVTKEEFSNGNTYKFVDFDKFYEMFDTSKISTVGLNKIFGGSDEGIKKLNTLKTFRDLSKSERWLQNAIYKKQSPLSEAAQKGIDSEKELLYSVGYFTKKILLNTFGANVIPSYAYDKMVRDLAKKQRYTLKDLDNTITGIEKTKEYQSFTPDEKVYLKNVRLEAEKNDLLEQQKMEEIIKQNEGIKRKELFEQLKQDTDNRIKANMLLEHKAIIPPAQIKEGAKEPLPLDVQDRISVTNTKQPSIEPVGQAKPTTLDEFTTKMGIDKNKIISDVETKKQFEELMKSPYFDEVVFNGQNTYAKDSKYAFSKDGQDKYVPENFAGQGNENGFNKINASYTPNDKFGTVFTKQDYNNLQKGNITEEIVNKLKLEIGDREQADLLAKEQFNKDFEQADKAGNIPFSNPIVGGASVGAASGTQTDFNQDGKVDEVDVMIGTLIGSIGIKKTMDLFPQYFKK